MGGAGSCCLLLLCILFATTACQAQPKVFITTKGRGESAFEVEIADTPVKRELGFQYRRELAPNRGMIFLFPADGEHDFWMKNTPIPLDMIFISSDRKIVGIIEQAVPFSLESRSVHTPSRFVLEINGGLSRRYGFKTGDSVRFEGISADVSE
jgi:uncharacterized membrane protein (UPF0127 family)